MGYSYPASLRVLIGELSKLPSVGERSATRLAFHLLGKDIGEAKRLADAILTAKQNVKLCRECFAYTEEELCGICSDSQRSPRLLCVVEKPTDVIALERSSGFRGCYHVLHGLWAPLRGVLPQHVRIADLLSRIQRLKQDPTRTVQEVILATGTTVEGDATALYISESLAPLGIQISRIAQGLPKGGELEYADDMTIIHALDGRQSMGSGPDRGF